MDAPACETLALVLEASDLYEAEWDAIVATEAGRLRTRWHDRRLELLVHRLRDRLPLAGFQASSPALDAACAAFKRDRALRRRLAALLLADSLSWMRLGLRSAA